MADPNNAAGVTVREVYGLIQGVESRLLQEIRQLGEAWDSQLKAHAFEHVRDRDSASQRMRWAITTVMSGGLALASLFIAIYKLG
jgi:hypothetical protein